MNPGSADQALDSVINVDIEWMQHFYAGLTKLPDPSRSSSAMDDELEMEMELINIINTAKKRNCMITAPANNSGRMGSCYLAAGMKPELDIRRIAASLINSAEATSVTTRAVSATSHGVSAAPNTMSSGLQKYSSALPTGAPLPAVSAAAASSGLRRGSGAVKVKKKRVRPSRRVPTTVLKTDTSNFKAMVEHFTGIPTATTTAQESTTSPPATAPSPQPTSSAGSPSFSKPLPHPAVCKIPNSSAAPIDVTTSAATATSPSPPLPSSNPTTQSVPALPSKTTAASMTRSADIPNSGAPEEMTMSLLDTAFFDELWS